MFSFVFIDGVAEVIPFILLDCGLSDEEATPRIVFRFLLTRRSTYYREVGKGCGRGLMAAKISEILD